MVWAEHKNWPAFEKNQPASVLAYRKSLKCSRYSLRKVNHGTPQLWCCRWKKHYRFSEQYLSPSLKWMCRFACCRMILCKCRWYRQIKTCRREAITRSANNSSSGSKIIFQKTGGSRLCCKKYSRCKCIATLIGGWYKISFWCDMRKEKRNCCNKPSYSWWV